MKIIIIILILLAIGGGYFFFKVLPPCNGGYYYSLSGCTKCPENTINTSGHSFSCIPCVSPNVANFNNTICLTPQMLAAQNIGGPVSSIGEPQVTPTGSPQVTPTGSPQVTPTGSAQVTPPEVIEMKRTTPPVPVYKR
jgi:hypothetical protein